MTKTSRCYPLTIIDDHSRFSVALQACQNEQGEIVKAVLSSVFENYGLPKQINVDNGNPWGCSDLESPSSVQVWLMKLGIRLSHSAPYHPQTNGKDERFHRTLKLEVLHQRLYSGINDIQSEFEAWRHIYNFKRPHQGINNQVPASRYHPSNTPFPKRMAKPEYDQDCTVKRVSHGGGLVRYKGNRYRVGKGLAGEYVALKETNQPNELAVYFMDTFIKKIHLGDKIMPRS